MRAFLLLLLAAPAFGHGGGLDKYGCHRDRKRGNYHCHKGTFDGYRWKNRRTGRKEMEAYRDKVEAHKTEKEKTGFRDDGCAPMDALARGRGRTHFGWVWNGISCAGLHGSTCDGLDCGGLYRTREGCVRARFRCRASTEYYRTIEKECPRFNACCKRSVARMRGASARRAIEGSCPEGYSRDMLKCEGSFDWCVPAADAPPAK